jgi:hypothetical protein
MLGAFYPVQEVTEGRARFFAAYEGRIGDRWVFLASGYVDGVTGTGERATAGIVRPHETYLERRGDRFELRFGFSNAAWGVLDELAPQDVVNPVDVARFALEDRGEARLPVPLARLRWLLPKDLSLEALFVPWARRGTFDQLDEPSSPFAPEELGGLPQSELDLSPENFEGGVRIRGTGRGVDWGASVYRDVVDFDRYEATPAGIRAIRPARVLLGGDVETALGAWVLRGEGAFFLDDPLQVEAPAPLVATRWSFQGGVGADRRLGENVLFVNGLVRSVPEETRREGDDELSLSFGLTRQLSSGTQRLKVFGVWNTSSESAFARAVFTWELVENLEIELGGGAFLGEGGPFLGLISDADFASARLRWFF